MSNPTTRDFKFDDFDGFASTVRDADMDMVLHNLSLPSWKFRFMEIGDIHVQAGDLGSGNLVRGVGKKGQYLAYLPLSGGNESTWNGTQLRRGTIGVMPPGTEFTLAEQEAHQWLSVVIPEHLVAGDSSEETISRRTSKKAPAWVNHTQPVAARRIVGAVSDILSAASSESFASSPAASAAAESLAQMVLPIIGKQPTADPDRNGRPKADRQTIINRALAAREESIHGAISASEMAASARVSQRTLHSAFKEHFGLSPQRYLELQRISEIHRKLLNAERDEVEVTEVMIQAGVWQWGRFAGRYRKIVGELPSETLKKRKPRRAR